MEIKISIKNLYKIYGKDPVGLIKHVQNGTTKKQLYKKYDSVLALNNVSIDIPAGKIQVIMGHHASGKSTLIRHLNGLIKPTSGEIIIGGQNILEMDWQRLREKRIASMAHRLQLQTFSTSRFYLPLLSHLTIAENVSQEHKYESQQWIERVGLGGYENHYPNQLSPDEQQRVGLARALATEAEILLMDESLHTLDPLLRIDMQDILLGLQKEFHKTIIFLTHDFDEALRIGENIAILRDGAVVQKGSIQEIILNPADKYVADIIKDEDRGKVLLVSSIMESTKLKNGPKIDKNTVVEDALKIISKSGESRAIVTDHTNRNIGSVEISRIIDAITRPAF